MPRVPRVLVGLMVVTAVVSILGAVSARNGMPGLIVQGLLVPPQVWRGEVWRLVTWVLYEMDPWSLVFFCLTIYWVGRDLVKLWGGRPFLRAYFGLAALAGVVTCLVGFSWSDVAATSHGGAWPVLCGLLVAWGVSFPARTFSVWMMLRLSGRQLVWATIGGTVLFAIFFGLARYVPHFTTELCVFAWSKRKRVLAVIPVPARKPWSFDEWLERDRRRR